ncbi:4-alpha-glucanotransferase dpe2, variant 3 [Balamuthia mandrillaris]
MTSSTVKLCFRVNYKTEWGQEVALVGDLPSLGLWNPVQSVRMNWVAEEGDWEGEVELEPHLNIEYKFVVVNSHSRIAVRWEGDPNRTLRVPPTNALLSHVWQEGLGPFEEVKRTAAFSKVIFRGKNSDAPSPSIAQEELNEALREGLEKRNDDSSSVLLQLKLRHDYVGSSKSICVVGSCETLGSWYPSRALPLSRVGESLWQLTILVPEDDIPFEYKYILRDSSFTEVAWESGPNRVFNAFPDQLEDMPLFLFDDGLFRSEIGPWKGAGAAVPVFSLRSENGLGVGEFPDIKLLIDWAKLVGLQLIQLLPVNDTTAHGMWWDSYPYSAISVFALHPIYLNLQQLDPPANVLKKIQRHVKAMKGDAPLDYERVMAIKNKYLKRIYSHYKQAWLHSSELKAFVKEHESWLPAYALFSYLKELNSTADFHKWPKYTTITEEVIATLTSPTSDIYEDNIAYHYFVQYHLSRQLSDASRYAAEKGVVIKGDLPIGVDPLSVDAWLHPHLFNLDKQTGAPPDYFAKYGQNWGFPTYNWEEMAKDNYSWWRQRLQVLSKYFHAYRIDHVLGFFRIWEIPGHCINGLLGRLNPSIPIWNWELEGKGVWDFRRLTDPYVTDELLQTSFGKEWQNIKARFFNVGESTQRIQFKPEYLTEKALQEAFDEDHSLPEKQKAETLKKLWDLLGNVILLRDEEDPERKFYPRVDMMTTSSFAELHNESIQNALRDLYCDYFYRRQDNEWRKGALKKLSVMRSASDMLICAEDLGMLANCVPRVLEELAILALRVQRMPKDVGVEFARCESYEYLSVCTPSTHDTSTLRGWWEEDPEATQRYYNDILGVQGTAPKECEPAIIHKILDQHLASPSMWAIFAVQDLFALKQELRKHSPQEERINEPAVRHHYWRYILCSLAGVNHKRVTYPASNVCY